MRKWMLLLTIIGLMLHVGALGAQDNALDLPILEEGETVSASFETTTDAQLYAFNGSEGDVVTITMEREEDSILDPFLMLLDSVGQVVATNDDITRGNLSSEIEDAELATDGTYFVLAMTFIGLIGTTDSDDSDAPYNYELTVSGFSVPDDMDSDTLRYAGIVVTLGTPVTLEISEDAPVFYVSFDGERGDEVDIQTFLSGDEDDVQDTLLYLFAPDGRRIGINDDPRQGELAAALEGMELPDDGRYLIFASGFFFFDIARLEEAGGAFIEGSFELSIEPS